MKVVIRGHWIPEYELKNSEISMDGYQATPLENIRKKRNYFDVG